MDFEVFLRKKRTRRNTLLAEPTIRTKLRAIKNLSKHVNLWDSEAVESYIDNASVCNGRKDILQYAYADWCKCARAHVVERLDIDVNVDVPDVKKDVLDRCIKLAKGGCLITQSLHRGVEINHQIKY